MTDLSDKKCLCIDYGYFTEVAVKLAQSFGKVWYYCFWEDACPTWHKYILGSGMENVEKVWNIWDYIDEVDLVVFPHVYQGSFQRWLRGKHIPVFGSGKGEDMELYRDRMKEILSELKLDVNEYKVLPGLSALREYLKTRDNKFIKSNVLRGGMESWKHETYQLSKPVLDELEHSLGVYKEQERFIVEEPVPDAVEAGFDGFCIDGLFPDKQITGIEIKGSCYVGAMISYTSLPMFLKKINQKQFQLFREYEYRGCYSNEVRYTKDGKGYLIDQTCRNPEPNTSLALEMYENYGEIVWQVANGIMPEIKYKYKYGVQVIIKSVWAISEPVAIYFPSEYRSRIKINNLSVVDGVYYSIPNSSGYSPQTSDVEGIGSVVGLGNTLSEAIKDAKKIAETVKGYCIKIEIDALDEASAELRQLEKFGVKLF